MIREKGRESKKWRYIKLIKIEVDGGMVEMRQQYSNQKNAGKQDEENRMNGNRRKSGSDVKKG